VVSAEGGVEGLGESAFSGSDGVDIVFEQGGKDGIGEVGGHREETTEVGQVVSGNAATDFVTGVEVGVL
jgi:hypothetical protein